MFLHLKPKTTIRAEYLGKCILTNFLFNCIAIKTQLPAKSWTFFSLLNVFHHLQNEMPTGHYRRVTLFQLCHGLTCLSLTALSLMIGTSSPMLICSSWNSSLLLCQGQLLRFTAAKQENTAACIKYKQAEHGDSKPLKMSVLWDKTCGWLVFKWLFSVCVQWHEGLDVGKLFGSFVVRVTNWQIQRINSAF